MSSSPLTIGVKIIFAMVILLIGWLFASMIPYESSVGKDWVVQLSLLEPAASQMVNYLDGAGTQVIYQKEIQQPMYRVAETYAELDPKSIKLKSPLEDVDLAKTNDSSKKQVLAKQSEHRSVAKETTLENFGDSPDSADMIAADMIAADMIAEEEEWRNTGQAAEQKKEDERWAKELQTEAPVLPTFKEEKAPDWNDSIEGIAVTTIQPPTDTSSDEVHLPATGQLIIDPSTLDSTTPLVTGQLIVDLSETLASNPPPGNGHFGGSSSLRAVTFIPTGIGNEDDFIRNTTYEALVPKTVNTEQAALPNHSITGGDSIVPASFVETVARPLRDANTPLEAPGQLKLETVDVIELTADSSPEQLAQSYKMTQPQYEKFMRLNQHKLDSAGRFPMQTKIIIQHILW